MFGQLFMATTINWRFRFVLMIYRKG